MRPASSIQLRQLLSESAMIYCLRVWTYIFDVHSIGFAKSSFLHYFHRKYCYPRFETWEVKTTKLDQSSEMTCRNYYKLYINILLQVDLAINATRNLIIEHAPLVCSTFMNIIMFIHILLKCIIAAEELLSWLLDKQFNNSGIDLLIF